MSAAILKRWRTKLRDSGLRGCPYCKQNFPTPEIYAHMEKCPKKEAAEKAK